MRVLVTGGAGFIGYHLARHLAGRGDEVVVVDDLSRGRMDASMKDLVGSDQVRFLQADLTGPSPLAELAGTFDGVVHLAAMLGVRNVMERPLEVISVNTRTLLNVLEWHLASNRDGTFLFASTSEVYAWTRRFHDLPVPTPEAVPLSVDDVRNRRGCYAASKLAGEMAVTHGCADEDLPWITVRYHNVYGPRMGEAHVIPELYRRIHEGQRPLKVYNVDHRRAFCHVGDAVRATAKLLDGEVASGVYNVGNDQEEIAIGDLAQTILEVAGRPEVSTESVETEDPGVERRCPDLSRLRQATHYRPEVNLQAGLSSTLAWYAELFSGGKPRV